MTRAEVRGVGGERLVWAGGDVVRFKGRTGIQNRRGLLEDGKNLLGGRGGPRAFRAEEIAWITVGKRREGYASGG